MKKIYRIVSDHDIYEDSYTEGEIKRVSTYDSSATIFAEDPKAAVREYMESHLYIDPKDGVEYDDDIAYTSKMVDEDGARASNTEIEMWKKGELTLYSENITMRVYEMNQVTF